MNNNTEPKLKGKVALVTGGSRGIGAAIVRRLAQDGAAVAFTYASSPQKAAELAQAVESSEGRALAIQADSGNVEDVKNSVAETVKAYGRLDILVNNAGVLAFNTVHDFKIEDFDRLVAVNIKGLFVATQESLRHMGEGGRIINIGSVNSDYVAIGGLSVYALTKGAVAAFTQGLARDLGPRGITVNNIQPGPVDTDMNPATGAFSEKMKSVMALGRYGKGEEIASMVSYLASSEAAFVTGAGIKVDGGFTA
jgi:3-oxoacyl-[acyl-carrier protein] reductase